MRRCGRCHTWKVLEDFGFRHKAAGVRHTICKPCQAYYRRVYYERHTAEQLERARTHMKRYRVRNREYVNAYLRDHSCVDCGLSECIVLEFDHVRGKKEAAVGVMVAAGVPLSRLKAEIAKCSVRCANCHRRRTVHERLRGRE